MKNSRSNKRFIKSNKTNKTNKKNKQKILIFAKISKI